MDLKALIAKMDQIESKQMLTEGEDRPDAKKKETSWTDKSGKKHPATQVQGHQSVKADKEADKEKKKDLDEMNFQSGIAKGLLKEFNLEENPFSGIADYFKKNAADYRARQASGELPPDGWDQERDGPWMGKNPAMANVVDGSGNPIKTGSGGNLQSLGQQPAGGAGTKPATQKPAPIINRDINKPDAVGLNNPSPAPTTTAADFQKTDKDTSPVVAPSPMVVPPGINPETGDPYTPLDPNTGPLVSEPPGTPEEPTEPTADLQTIDPAKLARFKELLAKAGKPATGAATKPASTKKPATGAATKPAAPAAGGPKVPAASAGANSPAYDTQDQGQISSTPAAESTKLRDDQILALIRGM